MARYFSDRERGGRPRTNETIPQPVWDGLYHLITTRIADGSFGERFPEFCPDGNMVCGCDAASFWRGAKLDIPELNSFFKDPKLNSFFDDLELNSIFNDHKPIVYGLETGNTLPVMVILDFLEFCFDSIGKVERDDYHSFWQHDHLYFDKQAGQHDFRNEINRIFARNGIAFQLEANGHIIRLAPEVLRPTLTQSVFATGDGSLDQLLEAARAKFLSPDEYVRHEALEKLWDAFERLKTIEPGKDKKAQATALLDHITDAPRFREALNREAIELTSLGNQLHIRHSETTQEEIKTSENVDYLFHRLYAFVRLALRATGREVR